VEIPRRPGLALIGFRGAESISAGRGGVAVSTWFSKEMGNAMYAEAPQYDIQKAFLPLFVAAGQPDDMAVFSVFDVHSSCVTLYFSPAAATLAQMFGAVACDAPSPYSRDFGMLVGEHGAWEALFPGYLAKRRQAD
jgi:hypothetical protein